MAAMNDAVSATESLFAAALQHHRSARLAEAAGLYESVLQRQPGHVGALFNLATLQAGLGDAEGAAGLYRRVLDVAPNDADTLTNLGCLEIRLGRGDRAEGHLRRALAAAPDNAEAHFNLAALLRAAGDPGALAHYQAAATLRPGWAAAHVGLALALDAAGRRLAAFRRFRQALAVEPGNLAALRGLAQQLRRRGRWRAALDLLRRAAAAAPGSAEIQFEIANLLHDRGDLTEAVAHYRSAIAIDPAIPELHCNLGSALLAVHDAEAAVEAQRRAIALRPGFAFAHNNLGNALSALARLEEARAAYAAAVEADPDFVAAMINLGNILRLLGRAAEALDVLERAVARQPADANAHNNLGLVHQGEGRHRQAIACFEEALRHHPRHPEALNNLAVSYQGTGRFLDAIRLYRDIIALYPDRAPAYFNLGGALQLIGRYDESALVFQQALAVRPDYNAVYPYLAHALMQQCSWANLDAVISRMLSNIETELATGQPVSVSCFGLMSTPAPMPLRHAVARQIADRAAAAMAETRKALAFRHCPGPRPRLRIGYVSPDFRQHSVAMAFLGLLESHDRRGFEICGYSLAPLAQDAVTERLSRGFDRFHDVSALSHRQAAELIHGEGVDILIDLAGHTRFSRLEIFALQPAPLQVHYLGYSSTIGGDFLQYLITDRHQIAPGIADCFSEKLVYLPDTFMATTHAEVSPEPVRRADFALPVQGFVFCNFNAHYKFEPRLWGIWMRLLKRLPGSVLWMLSATPTTERNLKREAELRGVDPARLIFSPKAERGLHLARQRLADLALDTLHHGGGVTTTDALWVGLPVLTVAGESPPSRNGASLLAAIGLDQLIADSIDGYERIAFALATQPGRLAELRARLQANRDTHPLFDTKRLTRHLESAYRLMWQRFEQGLPPDSIEVPPLG